MQKAWVFCCLCFQFFILIEFRNVSMAQLIPSESRILLQVQQFLEYPQALNGWNKWTNFCFLPYTPSVSVNCTGNRVTQLTIIGNKSSPSHYPSVKFSVPSNQSLSARFSIDSFFTVLTKLPGLRKLTLVSLGIWGPLPPKISRFLSLEVLNFSSNFIYGDLPTSMGNMKSLRSLVLADNVINGSVPDLSGLMNFGELDLGLNNIGPQFPSLGNNLVSIILRNNSLRSEIPAKLNGSNQLQWLDVSSNHLVGPIPSFVFSLPALLYLNLARNQLTGAIDGSTTCGRNLSSIDISSNLLKGDLPSCIAQRNVSSSGNCLSGVKHQHSASSCQTQALAVEPLAKNDQKKQDTGIRLGLVLGIIGGIIGFFVVAGLLVIGYSGFRRSANDENVLNKSVTATNSGRTSPMVDTKYVPRTLRVPVRGIPPYRVFTIEDLEEATNNFDKENFVEEGSQGQIFKGMLQSGSAVIIECIKLKQKQSAKSLNHYTEVISHLQHQNLVSVLGHCIVSGGDHVEKGSIAIFIVLKHVANGSLRDHLTDWRRKDVLKWPQRMTISLGIAKGLHFLHAGMSPGIFGNNLKIENILLDETLTPKLSKYRIPLPAKAGKRSSADQDAHDTVTGEKDDIHQLGIILLEILTGKQPQSHSEQDELKLELEKSLAAPASVLQQVVDSSMRGTFAYQSLRTAADITVNCLNKNPSMRPSMEDVLWHLQYSIQVQQTWTSSGNLGFTSGNLGMQK
ncbi:hypothetical protein Droror1_Dr00018424 [Drosera rotundifolia]